VVDSGAHRGLLVSSAGFQTGAYEAAQFSNLDLLSWEEFQRLFLNRWFTRFMKTAVAQAADAVNEYTEPVNSGIARKATHLSESKLQRYRELREFFGPAATALFMLMIGTLPSLPIRSAFAGSPDVHLPADVLDACSFRPLLASLCSFYASLTAE